MGFPSTLLIVTLLRDSFLLVAHLMLSTERVAWLSISSARWAVALTVLSTVAGLVIARRPRLVEVDIPVTHLPTALHGFSIAQISDLHVGPTIKRGFVERIVARVNDLNADLIAVTGDLVDGSVLDLSRHTAPLAGLAARHGVYFVTGNHEYYSGQRRSTAELRRFGLILVQDQHVILHDEVASVVAAGRTEFCA